MPKLYCFGEILWDLFPSGAKPGGAPMNVAIHAQNLGLDSHMISAIGDDVLGSKLLDLLAERGVGTAAVTRGEQPTGTVTVDTTNPSEVKYTIEAPSAWDFIDAPVIEWQPGDLLLHGSLAARNQQSYQALQMLRAQASVRVFDLNLRAPFIDRNKIEALLLGTEIVKVNEEEYALLAEWLELPADASEGFKKLSVRFGTQDLILTRGSRGAQWINSGGTKVSRTYAITVKDTVGAGDSFLAAMIFGISHQLDPQLTLDYAAGLGAMVASKEGANPSISKSELKAFVEAQ